MKTSYKVRVFCKNCQRVTAMWVDKGVPVSSITKRRCPQCACENQIVRYVGLKELLGAIYGHFI